MKMKKRFMRFVSFFLSFVLFMSMVPAGAYATEANINDDKAGIIAEEPGSSDRIDPADPTLETDPANEDDPDEQVEDPEKITDGDVTEPVDDKKDPDEELEDELPPDDVVVIEDETVSDNDADEDDSVSDNSVSDNSVSDNSVSDNSLSLAGLDWNLSGDGSMEDPYKVENAGQLIIISSYVNKGISYYNKYFK